MLGKKNSAYLTFPFVAGPEEQVTVTLIWLKQISARVASTLLVEKYTS